MKYINYNNVVFPMVGIGTFTLHGHILHDVLDVAVSYKGMLVDTAFKYNNEEEIGRYLSAKEVQKGDVILQAKLSVVELVKRRFFGIPISKKTPAQSLTGSCERLKVNPLDVYLLHSPSAGYVERYKSILELRERGLVKLTGVCNFNLAQIKEIYEKCGEYPQVVQIEMHPFFSNKQVIDFCKDKGILIEARSPFAHGDVMEELLANQSLAMLAQEYDKTVPQVVLRWIIQQGIVALPRSKNPEHVKENFNIFDFDLTEKQMSVLDSLNRNQSFGFKSQNTQE